jgi:TolB-like protein/DNA-binding winged helix-turn-helix (wHTH) protein/thioredoxin-like negative regulator of GroEL
MTMSPNRSFAFGEFTLDLRRGALFRAGMEVKLRPKSFEVLRVLVERHGQLVSKEDLLAGIWGRAIVTDGAVTQCLIDVRRALGDESQQIVRTVPRRGYVFDAPVVESLTGPPAASAAFEIASQDNALAPPRSKRMAAVMIAAAVMLLVLAGTYLALEHTEDFAPPVARPAGWSIAVLPFVDMSEAHDQQYLSDGVTEEILDRLANSKGLTVIARTSSFQFRDRPLDVAAIARKLNVTHVLEGSVRRSGDQVRVTVQLIDASTRLHVWSRVYDRSVNNLFSMQSEIAGSVASSLQARLTSSGASKPPRNSSAYENYLRGKYFFGRRGEGDLDRAIANFERAVALDPEFARGWADLSGAYNAAAGDDYATEWKSKQKFAAQRAVEADPGLIAGHIRLAGYYFDVGDGLAAREQFRIASTLDPSDTELARLAAGAPFSLPSQISGREIEESRQAVARDPLTSTTRFLYGLQLFAVGRLDDALTEFRFALELNPGMDWDQRLEIARVLVAKRDYVAAYREMQQLPAGSPRAYALAMLIGAPDRRSEAEAAFAALSAVKSGGHIHFIRMAELCVLRGRRDEAFAWLERARTAIPQDATRYSRTWWLQAEMRLAPFLRSLHQDARWDRLMTVPDWAAPLSGGTNASSEVRKEQAR